jgi:hypothetical protein
VSARQISTSVTWGDVASVSGVLILMAVAFAVRLGDFRQAMMRHGGPNGFRAGLVFAGTIYGFFVVIDVVMAFRAAHMYAGDARGARRRVSVDLASAASN